MKIAIAREKLSEKHFAIKIKKRRKNSLSGGKKVKIVSRKKKFRHSVVN